jgi:hypothetical protein
VIDFGSCRLLAGEELDFVRLMERAFHGDADAGSAASSRARACSRTHP